MADIERDLSGYDGPICNRSTCVAEGECGCADGGNLHGYVDEIAQLRRENLQLRGAVERAERAEELAVRLYRLMGEEAERVCPGELESSELLRDHFGGR